MSALTFSGCFAAASGAKADLSNTGAAAIENTSNTKLERVYFLDNLNGGIISWRDLDVDNSVFYNNDRAIELLASEYENNIDILNVVFVDNKETIYTETDSIVNIVNSAFYNQNVIASYHINGTSKSLKLTNTYVDISLIPISYYGQGIIAGSINPGFVDYVNQDFHLLSSSLLRDAGLWKAIDLEIPTIDLDLYERDSNLSIDIGAYEYR